MESKEMRETLNKLTELLQSQTEVEAKKKKRSLYDRRYVSVSFSLDHTQKRMISLLARGGSRQFSAIMRLILDDWLRLAKAGLANPEIPFENYHDRDGV